VEQQTLLIILIALMVAFDACLVIFFMAMAKSLKLMAVTVERQQALFEDRINPVLDVVKTCMEEKINPLFEETKTSLVQFKGILENIEHTTENFVSVSEMVKEQAEKVNLTLQETTDRARVQIARADEVVTDFVEKLQVSSEVIQQNILTPVREISALIRGVSCALEFLFKRQRPPVDRVHQDEELFI
jgi:hypothetical protein